MNIDNILENIELIYKRSETIDQIINQITPIAKGDPENVVTSLINASDAKGVLLYTMQLFEPENIKDIGTKIYRKSVGNHWEYTTVQENSNENYTTVLHMILCNELISNLIKQDKTDKTNNIYGWNWAISAAEFVKNHACQLEDIIPMTDQIGYYHLGWMTQAEGNNILNQIAAIPYWIEHTQTELNGESVDKERRQKNEDEMFKIIIEIVTELKKCLSNEQLQQIVLNNSGYILGDAFINTLLGFLVKTGYENLTKELMDKIEYQVKEESEFANYYCIWISQSMFTTKYWTDASELLFNNKYMTKEVREKYLNDILNELYKFSPYYVWNNEKRYIDQGNKFKLISDEETNYNEYKTIKPDTKEQLFQALIITYRTRPQYFSDMWRIKEEDEVILNKATQYNNNFLNKIDKNNVTYIKLFQPLDDKNEFDKYKEKLLDYTNWMISKN